MEKPNPDWIKLPKDLLLSVTHLLSRTETRLLRAVCDKFRQTIPIPKRVPSPITTISIPSPVCAKICDFSELSLKKSTFYAIQPVNKIPITPETSPLWLISVEESNFGQVRFKDPLTGSRFPELNDFPESLNLLDHRVKEIAVGYDLGFYGDRKRKDPELEGGERRAYFVQKVAVSPRFDDKDDSFAVMAIYSMNVLGIWRKGDADWTKINIGDGEVYLEDIAYYNGKFYALNMLGVTVSVDPKSLQVTEVAAAAPKFNGTGVKYLIKTGQDLLLVVKQIYVEDFGDHQISNGEYFYPIRMIVLKLDEKNKQWVRVVDGLQETALFLDNDYSFSLSVKEFPGCKENCVYFADSVFMTSGDKFPGCYAGIYDMKSGDVEPLSAYPNYSKIFWPPPPWLNVCMY